MNLSKLFIHFAAIIAGFVVYHLVWALNAVGELLLEAYLQRAGTWARWPENWPLVVDWARVGHIFFRGYPLGIGLTTTFFFWNGWPRESARLILYLLVLAIIGPLTYINYVQSDQWLNLWVQSGFNIFVAFCGYAAVIKIRTLRGDSADLLALQSLSILIITSLMIALPLFNTGIFLSVAFHIIDHHTVKSIPDKVPLAIAGAAGTVAVLLSNLEKLRSTKSDNQR